ncbi:putative protein OS=Streptomyces griseorubiginosus OX=67304 GN=AQJ54_40410 PE=4 SV=1 [Streptomyces griseorubiginosus]
MPPVALGTRTPSGAVTAVAPGVYRYAQDVLLEIVQSGLWVRPPAEPFDGYKVRTAPADPAAPAILYDQGDPAIADRMRTVAYDLVNTLDPAFADSGRVLPASAAGRIPPETYPAAHVAFAPAVEPAGPVPAIDAAPNGRPVNGGSPARPWPEGQPGPAGGWSLEGGPSPAPAQPAARSLPASPLPLPPEPVPTWTEDPPSPGESPSPVRPLVEAPRTADPSPGASSQVPAHPGPPPAASFPRGVGPVGGGAEGAPVPSAPHGATTPPGGGPSAPDDAASAASVHVSALAPRIRLESPDPPRPAADPAAEGTPATRPEAGPASPPPEPSALPASPMSPTAPTPASDALVRVQPQPAPAADVLPPAKGVERERDWLRRNLGARYDTAAALVSRVLSEAPGLHGGPRSSVGASLTDLAAVRLYLTGSTTAIDAAIRSGATGPHVPLARCVASGLRRLPSHRGGAIVRAALTPAERAWYRENMVVVERSFLAALSSIRPRLPGDTDIVLWSLTARRTALVVPELPDRLLFAPGTRFKVLRTIGGDRPAVLMREMAAAELDERGQPHEERVPLDEIALTGLDHLHALWQKAEDATDEDAMGDPLPPEHADAFRAAPGLLQRPPGDPGDPGAPTPARDPGTTPQQGGTP